MKLEVHERIALLSLLPKEGDFAALKSIRRAREIFSFTPEEIKFFELQETNEGGIGKTTWNSFKAAQQIKDCPIEEYIMDVVRAKLSELNRQRKLTQETVSLYEKFVAAYT